MLRTPPDLRLTSPGYARAETCARMGTGEVPHAGGDSQLSFTPAVSTLDVAQRGARPGSGSLSAGGQPVPSGTPVFLCTGRRDPLAPAGQCDTLEGLRVRR